MKKLILIPFVVLFALTFNLNAKENGALNEAVTEVSSSSIVLKGIVSDKLTNETLAGAVITANGQKVYSDLDGNFLINNVCEGKCTIKVNMISYEEMTLEVNTKNNKQLEIKLSQR